MANQKYIKVTLKGETKSHIVLATLKNFYISQGARIEHPTDEEVYAAVPQERPAGVAARPANPAQSIAKAAEAAAEAARTANEIAELKKENLQLQKGIETKDAVIKEHEDLIADLREKLAASEAAQTETENALEAARKELAAKERKPKAAE